MADFANDAATPLVHILHPRVRGDEAGVDKAIDGKRPLTHFFFQRSHQRRKSPIVADQQLRRVACLSQGSITGINIL